MSARRCTVCLALTLAAGTWLVGGCGTAQAPKQDGDQTTRASDPSLPDPVEAPEPAASTAGEPAESVEPTEPATIEPPVLPVTPDQTPVAVLPESPVPEPPAPDPPLTYPPPLEPIGKAPPQPLEALPEFSLPDSTNPLRASPSFAPRMAEPDIAAPSLMATSPADPATLPGEDPAEVFRGPAAMPDADAPRAAPAPVYAPPIVTGEGESFGAVTRGDEPLNLEPFPAPQEFAGEPWPSEALEMPVPRFEPAARSDEAPGAMPEDVPLAPETSSTVPETIATGPEPPVPSPEASLPPEPPAESIETAASPEPTSPAVAREEGDFAVVQVFYGTDRVANQSPDDRPVFASWLMWTAGCAGVTLILLAFALRKSGSRTARALAGLGVAATVVLGLLTGYAALYDVLPGWKTERPRLAYGMERGRGVELGTCEVSIPKRHEVGVLESPSIFKLELRESPDRHVVLLEVERLPEETFYTALSERVARSTTKDAFVFVHGYNVSFEDAARRTAQIAYDLDFPGAPIFYSWPSQASLTGYTVDENNVEWTVPHLREFLAEVTQRSGAEQVHLVAHSMGNRALAGALRGLSYRPDVKQPMFNHVVLTAPDVDADVFRRDLAPRIVKTAERVTLYASSNDKALSYSKTVHGYPRAGDTGEDLVVVPGIDTIDVSAVDTSLFGLGHLYYGSNRTVLADLFDLIRKAKPPEQRRWLRPELLGSLRYWVFEQIEAARAAGTVPR